MNRGPSDTQPAPPGTDSGAGGSVAKRKFVRVIENHSNGLVRFEFAVGWADLSCELVLPRQVFEDFCERNEVEFMTEPAAPGINTLPAPEPFEP